MPEDTLDIAPFERAVKRLEEGLEFYQRGEQGDPILYSLIRDGLIRRFEFTYELGHKILRRYLAHVSPNPGSVQSMELPDLIRTANEKNLLKGDWDDWKTYRAMRGKTSYTHEEEVALGVVKKIPEFIEEVIYLRDELRRRLS